MLLFHDDVVESVGTTTLLLPEQQVIPPDEPQRRRSHRLCLVLGSCVEGGSGREGVGGREWEGGSGREGVGGREWEGGSGRGRGRNGRKGEIGGRKEQGREEGSFIW